eukprot:360874-Chlamydomonas_euryale.AAC.23
MALHDMRPAHLLLLRGGRGGHDRPVGCLWTGACTPALSLYLAWHHARMLAAVLKLPATTCALRRPPWRCSHKQRARVGSSRASTCVGRASIRPNLNLGDAGPFSTSSNSAPAVLHHHHQLPRWCLIRARSLLLRY